jgi:hypothetical protein
MGLAGPYFAIDLIRYRLERSELVAAGSRLVAQSLIDVYLMPLRDIVRLVFCRVPSDCHGGISVLVMGLDPFGPGTPLIRC